MARTGPTSRRLVAAGLISVTIVSCVVGCTPSAEKNKPLEAGLELLVGQSGICLPTKAGDIGVLFGLRIRNTGSSDAVINEVSFSISEELQLLEASIVPNEVRVAADRFPPRAVSAEAWEERAQVGSGDAVVPVNQQRRLLLGVAAEGEAPYGSATGISITYTADGQTKQYQSDEFTMSTTTGECKE